MQHAASVTTVTTAETAAYVSGSVGLTPYSSLDSQRMTASAPAMPIAIPADDKTAPSLITIQKMSRRAAPRARRMPKSRSEEHTSELQSLRHLVCRLLLEKKKPMKTEL